MRCCRQPPFRREPHRPGRRRAMALFPVDPSGGDGRACARLGAGGTPALPGSHHCAGGTPALPGSSHPMTSSHQGHKFADASWCRLSLKEVHLFSCLFVSIRGSSSLMIGRFSSNDPHGRAGAWLNIYCAGGLSLFGSAVPARHCYYRDGDGGGPIASIDYFPAGVVCHAR